ncbi:MAG: hypothetical protein KatS3mg109_0960 [Pirellulaceae bacterium]|nr:MAG: hypothetical protein KatS3mg109_0960 [Pirellulaceae bacterium]GIW94507.1 MAG: hypothetical protein KatS3mg110_2548 [Pirellulaceae bacterium]
MREAVALVERLCLGAATGEEIVIGFRRDGSASIYVNQDPAWHFNRFGQLRRAYESGQLIKAERGRLFRMVRRREPHQVVLASTPMTEEEQAQWVAAVTTQIQRLEQRWHDGELVVVEQIPPDQPVADRARQLLASLAKGFTIAASPSLRRA